LDDPDKYMSSVHTEISVENGQYFLVDISTNGTFFNGSSEPLGSGNKVILAEGDRFIISDYEFIVNFRGASPAGEGLSSQPMGRGPFLGVDAAKNGDVEAVVGGSFLQNDPFAVPAGNYVPLSDAMSGFDAAETDPLAALDKARVGSHQLPSQSSLFVGTVSDSRVADHGGIMNDSIDWPDANIETGAIPVNWCDDDKPDVPVTAESQVVTPFETPLNHPSNSGSPHVEMLGKLARENKKLMNDVAQLKQQIKEQNANRQISTQGRVMTATDQTLIEALGFSEKNLNEDKMLEISKTAGLLVRETMEGMMQVLSFRKKIKEEFRINVTTIQPIENNPLKFSANVDDAMENMFIKENNAYKEPIEAVREGFQGIAEHQVAVLAGMQSAFRGMLERFDPETLEKRFEKYKKTGLIQIGKKRQNWESYKAYHAELAENPDNSFQYLFGHDFVQAYEEQMQRLVIARGALKKS
jgi:type VI secretion system FHA domain protein